MTNERNGMDRGRNGYIGSNHGVYGFDRAVATVEETGNTAQNLSELRLRRKK